MKKLMLLSLGLCFAPLTWAQANHSSQDSMVAPIPKAAGIWIDVRSPEEFQSGHLQDALNIPFDEIADHIATVAPNKDVPIHLYCRSGRRAEVALNILKDLGYTQVINHGAYEDLRKQGYQ